ncbi:MAG: hypothetical protein QOE45_3274, partial [Frankiaceae bacterium]|nr:hypothetical protein [Frankiaceae bacterium]
KDAAAAVRTAPAYPAAAGTPLYLSGTDALVADKGAVQAGSAQMAEAAAPTSQGGGAIVAQDGQDAPGTSVSYTTPPLTEDLDVVGIPSATFRVDAPTFTGSVDPAQHLLLFAKLYDVAPDGTATLHRALISAARIKDPTKPVTIELPGIVHRYAKGHSLRLTVSTSAATYRGGLGAGPVSIVTDPKDPGVLTIPVLGNPTGAIGSGPNGYTPFGVALRHKLPRAALLPRRLSCHKTRLTFRLRKPRMLAVARVKVNGKRVRTLRGARLRRPIRLTLSRATPQRVVVTARTVGGNRRRNGQTYRSC